MPIKNGLPGIVLTEGSSPKCTSTCLPTSPGLMSADGLCRYFTKAYQVRVVNSSYLVGRRNGTAADVMNVR